MHQAFAAQTLANIQLLGSERFAREVLGRAHATGEVDDSKFNVLGGSIAYGHPFAATGARMITQTLHELRRRGGGFGLVTACAAGGLARQWFWRRNNGNGISVYSYVRLDNIAVITIDVPGEKMNTLKAEFASQVRAIIKQLRENKELRGVAFVSAKPDNFIARRRHQHDRQLQNGARSGSSGAAGPTVDGGDSCFAHSGYCRYSWRLPGRWAGAGAGVPRSRLY